MDIFCIDDDRDALREIKASLTRLKAPPIATYTNAESALMDIFKKSEAVVFLDMNMPGMNGSEALEKLSINEKYRIVVVTAFKEFDYAMSAWNNRADKLVIKPYTDSDILAALKATKQQRNNAARPDNLWEKRGGAYLVRWAGGDDHILPDSFGAFYVGMLTKSQGKSFNPCFLRALCSGASPAVAEHLANNANTKERLNAASAIGGTVRTVRRLIKKFDNEFYRHLTRSITVSASGVVYDPET